MRTRKISELDIVKSEHVPPLYTASEIKEKLAAAVNAVRTKVISADQGVILELIYSLACAIDDKIDGFEIKNVKSGE